MNSAIFCIFLSNFFLSMKFFKNSLCSLILRHNSSYLNESSQNSFFSFINFFKININGAVDGIRTRINQFWRLATYPFSSPLHGAGRGNWTLDLSVMSRLLLPLSYTRKYSLWEWWWQVSQLAVNHFLDSASWRT